MEENKGIALVTGGAGGIGEAICRALHHAGFTVAIHYNRSKEPAEKLASELPGSFILQGDISTVEGIDSMVDVLKKEHAGNVSVLVNNAGLALDNPVFSATLDEFDKTISTNMRSTWYLTKRISRFMIRKKAGRIINVTSVVGVVGNPTQSLYGMTKAAIDNFTKTAAKEFADYGILVNSVAPGYIKTSMTEKLSEDLTQEVVRMIPLGRMGEPVEVADMVEFLATRCSYCTGSIFHVNGGLYG